ncbi:MAG: hypothetical protein WA607_04715 [Candidatus Sulfotelmatobacter sp.]
MLKRILLAATMSWVYAVTLGLLFAACASGRFSFSTLGLPGVVPVALIASTVAAIAMTPIATWSVRTGARNLRIYGSILWIVLAGWVVAAVRWNPAYGLYGVLILGLVGLVFLGFIPAVK